MSDIVLFSAAIPGQGGENHINEQWPEFWSGLFNERGYVGLDFVRRRIWNDRRIPYWYKQNILLYVKEERISDLKLQDGFTQCFPLSVVHPELFLNIKEPSIKRSMELLLKAIKRRIERELKIGNQQSTVADPYSAELRGGK